MARVRVRVRTRVGVRVPHLTSKCFFMTPLPLRLDIRECPMDPDRFSFELQHILITRVSGARVIRHGGGTASSAGMWVSSG